MQVSLNFARAIHNIFHDSVEHRITYLSLQRNSLGDEGANIIINAISNSRALIYLNLASNNIGPTGMDYIFKGLTYN